MELSPSCQRTFLFRFLHVFSLWIWIRYWSPSILVWFIGTERSTQLLCYLAYITSTAGFPVYFDAVLNVVCIGLMFRLLHYVFGHKNNCYLLTTRPGHNVIVFTIKWHILIDITQSQCSLLSRPLPTVYHTVSLEMWQKRCVQNEQTANPRVCLRGGY